jgi:hypothetical protein
MNFAELVVFLVLVPPVLAKLARLLKARERPWPNNEPGATDLQAAADAPKDVSGRRQGHKWRRSRRKRHR